MLTQPASRAFYGRKFAAIFKIGQKCSFDFSDLKHQQKLIVYCNHHLSQHLICHLRRDAQFSMVSRSHSNVFKVIQCFHSPTGQHNRAPIEFEIMGTCWLQKQSWLRSFSFNKQRREFGVLKTKSAICEASSIARADQNETSNIKYLNSRCAQLMCAQITNTWS